MVTIEKLCLIAYCCVYLIIRSMTTLVFHDVNSFLMIDSAGVCNNDLSESEYLALQSFYSSTNGPNWCWHPIIEGSHWNFSSYNLSRPCSEKWQGLTCACYNNETTVTSIRLSNYCLNGTIPNSIGDLLGLRLFELNYNLHLRGPLPVELSKLTNLKSLVFTTDGLQTTIPSALFQMSWLYKLELTNCSLIGTIPNIVNMPRLFALDIALNSLTGTIPKHVSELKTAQVLGFSVNRLNGTIPEEFYAISTLTHIDLYGNQLQGSISSNITQLIHLEYLLAYQNSFTGTLPEELGQLTKLYAIDISANQLSGTIPKSLRNMKSLNEFTVAGNRFTGPISIDAFIDLPIFQYFEVDDNYLTGNLEVDFPANSSLLDLSVFDNHLTGSIPVTVANLTNLENFYIYMNYFTGSLPVSIGMMTSLNYFFVQSNHFTGKLTNVFQPTKQRSLIEIDVTDNLFSGSIPNDLFLFPSLTAISTTRNCFMGRLPSSMCHPNRTLESLSMNGLYSNRLCPNNFHFLTNLIFRGSFSSRNIHGTIPSCLFDIPSLRSLHLSGNGLSGTIPDMKYFNLTSLTLANNQLTGTIPWSLQRHSFADQLELQGNKLRGTLSSDFEVSPTQTSLTLAVNRLSGAIPVSILSSKVSTMNVLTGNIFDCPDQKLPPTDDSVYSYNCASNELDEAMTIFGAIFGAIAVIYMTLYLIFIRNSISSPLFYILVSKVIYWKSTIHVEHCRWIASALTSMDPKEGRGRYRSIQWFVFKQFQYLDVSKTLLGIVGALGVVCLLVLLPIDAVFNVFSSKYSERYGWTVSMTLLTDWPPAVFYLVLLIALIGATTFAIHQINSVCIDWNQSVGTSTEEFGCASVASMPINNLDKISDETAMTDTRQSSDEFRGETRMSLSAKWQCLPSRRRLQSLVLLVVLHCVNVSVSLSVNIAYVNNLVGKNKYSRRQLQLFQLLLGLFKVVWGGAYIPWAYRYIIASPSIAFGAVTASQNRFAMNLLNVIVAPVVATMISNNACFYYAFNPSPDTLATFTYDQCDYFLEVKGHTRCLRTETDSFTVYYEPPFEYSYNCGTALLIAYVPVLVYTYVFAGLIYPAGLLAFFAFKPPPSSKDVYDRPTEDAARPTVNDIADYRSVVDEGATYIMTLQHLTVLLTFGLAYPPLAAIVCVAALFYSTVWNVVAGMELSLARQWLSRCKGLGGGGLLPRWNPPFVSIARTSWKVPWKCWRWAVPVTAMFWSLLSFDMVADKHGVVSGGVFAGCFFGLCVSSFLISRFASGGASRRPMWDVFVGRCLDVGRVKILLSNEESNDDGHGQIEMRPTMHSKNISVMHRSAAHIIDDDIADCGKPQSNKVS